MYEARIVCLDALKKLNEGKMPNTPADLTAKGTYAIAMNQFAETAMLREIGSAEITEKLIADGKKFSEIA